MTLSIKLSGIVRQSHRPSSADRGSLRVVYDRGAVQP